MNALPPGSVIGILGGGQLGRMLAMAAARLGLQVSIYSDHSGPAFDVASAHVVGAFDDLEKISAWAATVDVVTYEFENVPLAAATAAAALKPNDAQRIQRALEIVRLTGRPLAESYARREMHSPPYRFISVALTLTDRAALHARIAQRFDAMLAAGFVDEVARLRRHYDLSLELPSMRCVGYRQAWDYLDGATDAATFRDQSIAATRQLAKRQLTWQRKFEAQWDALTPLDCLQPGLATRVIATVRRGLDDACG